MRIECAAHAVVEAARQRVGEDTRVDRIEATLAVEMRRQPLLERRQQVRIGEVGQAVDAGQIEAARALGLGRWHRFRLVILPQALRTILPPLGNDFIALVKDSSLVSVLGVADITQLGKVYAAGLDVVSTEPIRPDNPLLKAKNCFITPHISWAPRESRQRLMDIAVENLRAFLAGAPVNVVNP